MSNLVENNFKKKFRAYKDDKKPLKDVGEELNIQKI
jgi:hypothetical protein